jgi:hypothetical protein
VVHDAFRAGRHTVQCSSSLNETVRLIV